MNTCTSNARSAAAAVSTVALLSTIAVSFSVSSPSSAATEIPSTLITATSPPIIPLPPPSDFVPKVDNPYSPFLPGTSWVYRGGAPQERERIVVKVLDRTKLIEGIRATVVRDTVTLNGEIIEDTFDWYAQDLRGRVWYLGEDTRQYEDGQVVSTEGSWEAGVDGAQAGVIMFRRPTVGTPYRQEHYAGHAEDQAEFLTRNTQVATAAGVFKHVRMTEDTTPLDPDIAELKFYARGVGIVLEFDLAPEAGRTELVRFRQPRDLLLGR